MTAIKSKRHIYTSIAICALFSLTACGGGSGDAGGEQSNTSRTAMSLELKNWAAWSGDNSGSLRYVYDAETKAVTLTHNEPNTVIAFSRQTISPVGRYRLQFGDKQGANRGQIGVADDRQLSMAFASPADQGWVDVTAAFPVDVEFAPGTEFLNIRIIFSGEAVVGTFNMIPLGIDGEPLPDDPEPDDKPVEEDPPTTF